MSDHIEMTPELLAMLKKKPETKTSRKRKPKDPTADRSRDNWFQQIHTFNLECNYCPRVRATAELPDNTRICRFCWIEEKGIVHDGD